MLGAVGELRKMGNNVEVNAQVSRQIGAALSILKQRRAAGQADEVVIVHIGDNGYLALSQFEGLMQLLADVPRVIVFNLKEPRQWERPNNQIIAQVVARYGNAVLVDWHTYGLSHPELFARDGIHIGAAGARAYVALIAPLLNAP